MPKLSHPPWRRDSSTTASEEPGAVQKRLAGSAQTRTLPLVGVCVNRIGTLVSSTGDGTLGKCAVYRGTRPSIADGHVAIVRINQKKAYPEYVCDYLRFGFGALQVQRLFTGSTGLVELTPDQLATVRIELPPDLESQRAASCEWRKIEQRYRGAISDAEKEFAESRAKFLSFGVKGPSLAQAADDVQTEGVEA